jgi:transaldolase
MSSLSKFQGKIKVFSDGAEKKSLLEMNANPRVSGMTTNPSLMKKAGVTKYKEFCLDILKEIKTKPLSFEVFSDDLAGMEKQAREIGSWAQNVYVKIPVTNSMGVSTAPLVKKLTQEKIKLNITAIFTKAQVEEVTSALLGGAPSFVSVFAGRIADTGRDPLPFMKDSLKLCQAAGTQCELLWASCREFYNIVQAEEMGCHIITVPPDIVRKFSGLNKDLAEMSLETIRTFKSDAESSGFSLD